MVSDKTLRRKLQKKIKHKPHRRCTQCGEKRMGIYLFYSDYEGWLLFKYCGEIHFLGNIISRDFARCRPYILSDHRTIGCGNFKELIWSGGGTGRHIPSLDGGKGKKDVIGDSPQGTDLSFL